MPSYNFICERHEPPLKRTRIESKPWNQLREDEQLALKVCPLCGEQMERAPRGPSAQVKETLDNGAMRRKVERFKDAEKLYKDRADKSRQ